MAELNKEIGPPVASKYSGHDVANILDYCRMCGDKKSVTELWDVKSNSDFYVKFKEKLDSVNIRLDFDETLSNNICQQCYIDLNVVFVFCKRFDDAQTHLNNIYEEIGPDAPPTSGRSSPNYDSDDMLDLDDKKMKMKLISEQFTIEITELLDESYVFNKHYTIIEITDTESHVDSESENSADSEEGEEVGEILDIEDDAIIYDQLLEIKERVYENYRIQHVEVVNEDCESDEQVDIEEENEDEEEAMSDDEEDTVVVNTTPRFGKRFPDEDSSESDINETIEDDEYQAIDENNETTYEEYGETEMGYEACEINDLEIHFEEHEINQIENAIIYLTAGGDQNVPTQDENAIQENANDVPMINFDVNDINCVNFENQNLGIQDIIEQYDIDDQFQPDVQYDINEVQEFIEQQAMNYENAMNQQQANETAMDFEPETIEQHQINNPEAEGNAPENNVYTPEMNSFDLKNAKEMADLNIDMQINEE